MQYTKLILRDGRPYSELFDDIYYSSDENEEISGESEFQHVFFRHNGLPERWRGRDQFVIAELGFGSGLNCILSIREWLKHCTECGQDKTLHYVAIEKYPLSAGAILELADDYPDLKPFYKELIDSYPPAVESSHSRRLFDGRVVIHFKFMDSRDALIDDALHVDAWYLDGFSPAKNADMWSQDLFIAVAKNSRNGATCSTYTSAGMVKRNLSAAGFTVKKVAGHGKKREMLVAVLDEKQSHDGRLPSYRYREKPWFSPPEIKKIAGKNAVIIGAGIAGLSLAYSLVQRGWTVTIIDKHGDAIKESTSNPAPIIYPRLSIDNDVDMAFYIASYCYALYMFERLQKNCCDRFWFGDGLLQLMAKERITKIIDRYDFDGDFISIVEDFSADGGQAVVNYAEAGVVLPAILCDVLKKECGKSLSIIKDQVTKIKYIDGRWQCSGDAGLINDCEILIVANGTEVNHLDPSLNFPLEVMRGQVAILNENTASSEIKKTLNADVHITPAINNRHYLGATYTRGSVESEISDADNKELLKGLDEIYPDMFTDGDYLGAWVGFRTLSKDRVPIVGAIPDVTFYEKEYADIRHGGGKNSYKSAAYLDGLYISAAHGSRGFTSSFISAEIIASQICDEPSPVDKKIRDYVSPSRFIVNDLKRR